ncbi:Hpt domain-containing protein [Methylobacterium brachythecii]|uniref:HPt (Histidine-containing phosphotransfer) domain-containing protein n=1 Tax=Methylobacterium brachythecii TaxID=1176177 RepID=A0A7W6AJB3_9HYPH|nr:Hpt domain-containing protein [Methylobacterium brachythecii]MBB3902400.1 HPt (histidine-containing phosphotransfer) domain-containing protein [Methylobacterium brachythecii]GLS42249.1 hypothetical protein GCM10007884_02340 [Methylobacterium brachythecii]
MMNPAGGPSGDVDPAICDPETLADLADLFGKERLAHLLAGLDEEIARRLGQATTTSTDLGANAHALVSVSGTLGFMSLSQACMALEQACLDGASLDASLQAVQAEAARARPEIAKLRGSL